MIKNHKIFISDSNFQIITTNNRPPWFTNAVDLSRDQSMDLPSCNDISNDPSSKRRDQNFIVRQQLNLIYFVPAT